MTWRQANCSAVMSGSLQLPLKCARDGNLKKGTPLQQPPSPLQLGVLPGQHPGVCPYHMEDHHSSTWDCKYPWPVRHLMALYVGPCACRVSPAPPASCPHCISCHVWGVALRVLLGTDLPEEPGCSPHCGPNQSLCQESHSSQPGTTGNPPDGNLGRSCQWLPEILDPG